MNLTGKQLVEQGIVTGPIGKDNIQQHGVDLNLIEVKRINGYDHPGRIPAEGKTVLATRMDVPLMEDGEGRVYWFLHPGTYEVTMAQGCKVPADQKLQIIHRSSLFRNGGILVSSLFDAGFETERIGTIMMISEPIMIDEHARIAQIYATGSNLVENLYDGQWQKDKQRNNDSRATACSMHDNYSSKQELQGKQSKEQGPFPESYEQVPLPEWPTLRS